MADLSRQIQRFHLTSWRETQPLPKRTLLLIKGLPTSMSLYKALDVDVSAGHHQ